MFKVKIKNIGKLTDTEINIGQFTVFAGPNNTGKSFVSKLLYSFFSSMQGNPVQTQSEQFLIPVMQHMASVVEWEERSAGRSPEDNPQLLDLESKIKETNEIIRSVDNIEELIQVWHCLVNLTEGMWNVSQDLQQTYSKESRKTEKLEWGVDHLHNSLRVITLSLTQLRDTFAKGDPLSFIISGTGRHIKDNLIENFQVPNLSDLSADPDKRSEVEVGHFGKFVYSNEEVDLSMDMSWMSSYSGAIYLESPIYWKLKNALEQIRQQEEHRSFLWGKPSKRLDGVPKYFHDLASALSFQYTGEMAFPTIHEKLTGPHILGGKVTISELGNLSFQENGRSFSLPVTAMGIANLGILALLIERKVLDEESLIFIDEPEAHLHPAWQVIMAEALFELSLQGVTVVIATHSVDILKWLEVHVKKNPQDEPHIALNQFPANGDGVDEDFESRMARIKQELTKPFSDLYLKGI